MFAEFFCGGWTNGCGVVCRVVFEDVVIVDCVCGILCCDDLMSIGASIQECVFLILTVVFLDAIF